MKREITRFAFVWGLSKAARTVEGWKPLSKASWDIVVPRRWISALIEWLSQTGVVFGAGMIG